MIDETLYNQLRELSWRRKLTREEESALRSWLSAHPEAQADWELEAALNESMGAMPDVPVPSNFTARVLQAVEREEAAPAGSVQSLWTRLRWLPRLAFAGVVLCAGLLSYQQIQVHQNRERMRAVEVVSNMSSLPGPDELKDFNAIQALNQTPADEDLLAALK